MYLIIICNKFSILHNNVFIPNLRYTPIQKMGIDTATLKMIRCSYIKRDVKLYVHLDYKFNEVWYVIGKNAGRKVVLLG